MNIQYKYYLKAISARIAVIEGLQDVAKAFPACTAKYFEMSIVGEDNMSTVKHIIKTWAGRFTWHTSHALDERRFHKAVKSIYAKGFYNLSKEEIGDAIREANITCSSPLAGQLLDEKVADYSNRAVIILSYLHDTEQDK